MAVALMMDVHVPAAITEQLRRRDVDVLTAFENGSSRFEDAALLERAREHGRVVFTQDIRFKVLAESWQNEGRPFAGRLFGHQLQGNIGLCVNDIELIAKASTPDEWEGVVERLPL